MLLNAKTQSEDMLVENSIYYGDNREILCQFPDNTIDLIYADPPFFSNRTYELVWSEKYEKRAFEDRWAGGRRGINTYLEWMKPRLFECWRSLKPTGTLYLHCDWHAGHHLKILLDDIFQHGDAFRNEIIWFYPDSPGRPHKDFPRKHDTIFRYVKGREWTFNDKDIRVDILPASKERYKSVRVLGGYKYLGGKSAKTGKIPEDVWRMPVVKQNSAEALGYPTQKPLQLLERIVLASSNKGDIVLDPFCGCGTTLEAAQKHGRKWAGIDISYTACKEMVKRLKKLGVHVDIKGAPATLADLKKMKPFEFQNWVLNRIYGRANPKKVGDEGIDGWTFGGDPVQVKQSSAGDPAVRLLYGDLERLKLKRGVIVAFEFSHDAIERANELKRTHGVEILLKTVENLLKTPETLFTAGEEKEG